MDYSHRIQQEMQTGLPFEDRTLLFLQQWYDVRKATPEEDMQGKFDLALIRKGVETLVQVKKPSRTKNVFIEYMAVNGQPGWGITCDLLAKWLDDDTLMMVRLQRVRECWGTPRTDFKTCYARDAKGSWYRRPRRLDICREFSVSWLIQYANAKILKP